MNITDYGGLRMTLDMDKIVTKTVNGAKIVAAKATQTAAAAVDYTKNQIDKAAVRDQIKDLYRELGKLVYEKSADVQNGDNNLSVCVNKLDTLYAELEVLESKCKKG
jgi:hypothetical protein